MKPYTHRHTAALRVQQAVRYHLRPGESFLLPFDIARTLLESGLYRISWGSPPWAHHFRRSLPDRSCLHLVINQDRATLHRDRWDPRRGSLELARHCVEEAPFETGATLTVGFFLLLASRLIVRR